MIAAWIAALVATVAALIGLWAALVASAHRRDDQKRDARDQVAVRSQQARLVTCSIVRTGDTWMTATVINGQQTTISDIALIVSSEKIPVVYGTRYEQLSIPPGKSTVFRFGLRREAHTLPAEHCRWLLLFKDSNGGEWSSYSSGTVRAGWR